MKLEIEDNKRTKDIDKIKTLRHLVDIAI